MSVLRDVAPGEGLVLILCLTELNVFFFILIEKGRFIVLDLWGVRIDNLCGTSWTCILLDR